MRNEWKSTILWFLPVLWIAILPEMSFALAGIAERTSFFHYNDFAQIQRGHPSDICSGATNWCLALRREGHEDFKGIREIYLGTTPKFLAAHRFYEKNGFAEIGKESLPEAFPIMSVDTKFYMMFIIKD